MIKDLRVTYTYLFILFQSYNANPGNFPRFYENRVIILYKFNVYLNS